MFCFLNNLIISFDDLKQLLLEIKKDVIIYKFDNNISCDKVVLKNLYNLGICFIYFVLFSNILNIKKVVF